MNVEQVSISITKEQLSQLPVVSYPGKIQVINTDSEAVDAFKQILMSKTVGIDTETRPSFKKGHINSVALIQIATDHCCYLFRISKFGLTQCLVDFLQNTRINRTVTP
jgi:ribonuclease D